MPVCHPKMFETHLGDCLVKLKDLADDSVHACITDPPYGLDGLDENWDRKKIKKRMASASASKSCVGGKPPIMRFDPRQGRKLQKFLSPICDELFRVLMPGSFLVMFGQARLIHRAAIAVEDSGFEIRDMYFWERYGRPMAMSVDGPWKTPMIAQCVEPMIVATKPREGTYRNNWERWDVGLINTDERIGNRFPTSLMSFSRDHERHGHVTVKPVDLIAHIVRLITRNGQIVLDPFMGTGSHGEASLRCGRMFIGMEKDEEHFTNANERLRNTT